METVETVDGIVFASNETDSQPIALMIMPGRHLYKRGSGLVSDFLREHDSSPRVVVVIYVRNMEEVDSICSEMSADDGWSGLANGPYTLNADGVEPWEEVFAFRAN